MNQEKEDTNLELHHAIAQEARLYMAELRSKHSSTAWKLASLKDLDKATEIADPERYRLIDLIVQYATEGGTFHRQMEFDNQLVVWTNRFAS